MALIIMIGTQLAMAEKLLHITLKGFAMAVFIRKEFFKTAIAKPVLGDVFIN